MGLGLMGGGMARQLLQHGFPLTVYNRNRAKADVLKPAGAIVADSPRVAAVGADVIISMVADDDASRAVWLGEQGALGGAKKGAIAIESSTLTVGWIGELAKAAAERGCAFLDAPVTGSRTQAEGGLLLFLVGGERATMEQARPVLDAMSRDLVHIGPNGCGALVKLVNNAVCAVQLAGLAEGLALLEKSGVNVEAGLAVLTEGAPGSPLVKALAGRMTSHSYDPHFKLRLMAKDITYALGEAEIVNQPTETMATALRIVQNAIAAGDGEKDLAAVIEQFRWPSGS